MFGFEPEEAESLGSEGRFQKRVETFKRKKKRLPGIQHYFWWVVHNAIAHGLLAICPLRFAFRFHDWTSKKLNAI